MPRAAFELEAEMTGQYEFVGGFPTPETVQRANNLGYREALHEVVGG
jgi:hypothetical protein